MNIQQAIDTLTAVRNANKGKDEAIVFAVDILNGLNTELIKDTTFQQALTRASVAETAKQELEVSLSNVTAERDTLATEKETIIAEKEQLLTEKADLETAKADLEAVLVEHNIEIPIKIKEVIEPLPVEEIIN